MAGGVLLGHSKTQAPPMALPPLGTTAPSESSAYGWLMEKTVSEDLMGGVHRLCPKVGYIHSAQMLRLQLRHMATYLYGWEMPEMLEKVDV